MSVAFASLSPLRSLFDQKERGKPKKRRHHLDGGSMAERLSRCRTGNYELAQPYRLSRLDSEPSVLLQRAGFKDRRSRLRHARVAQGDVRQFRQRL